VYRTITVVLLLGPMAFTYWIESHLPAIKLNGIYGVLAKLLALAAAVTLVICLWNWAYPPDDGYGSTVISRWTTPYLHVLAVGTMLAMASVPNFLAVTHPNPLTNLQRTTYSVAVFIFSWAMIIVSARLFWSIW